MERVNKPFCMKEFATSFKQIPMDIKEACPTHQRLWKESREALKTLCHNSNRLQQTWTDSVALIFLSGWTGSHGRGDKWGCAEGPSKSTPAYTLSSSERANDSKFAEPLPTVCKSICTDTNINFVILLLVVSLSIVFI